MRTVITGPVYVVRDNIDTDQIIPAQYLNLVPTIAEEYEKLGSYALSGLPESLYPERFIKPGQLDSEYAIVIAGRNFGPGGEDLATRRAGGGQLQRPLCGAGDFPATDAAAASDRGWPQGLPAGAGGGPPFLSFSSVHKILCTRRPSRPTSYRDLTTRE